MCRKPSQQNVWLGTHSCFYKRKTSQFFKMYSSLSIFHILKKGIVLLIGPTMQIKHRLKDTGVAKSLQVTFDW